MFASIGVGHASSVAQVSASVDALEKEFDIIAHNMANVSTVGFKRRCNSFTKVMEAQDGGPEAGATRSRRRAPSISRRAASSRRTGRWMSPSTERASSSSKVPKGRCTRGTAIFQTNENGQIVDTTGRLVAGTAGPLVVPPNVDVSEVHVDDDGRVSGRQVAIGQFRIVEFARQGGPARPGRD